MEINVKRQLLKQLMQLKNKKKLLTEMLIVFSYLLSMLALMNPSNKGCGLVGRDLNSG